MPISSYDTRLGQKGLARFYHRHERLEEGAMEKKDTNCADLKQEHSYLWDIPFAIWRCRTCKDTVAEMRMNRIVERTVATDAGHVITLWPAQVELSLK